MSKTLVIIGFGPGISTAVAEKFGAAGFSVALLARNAERIAEGVAVLKAKGVAAAGFTADAGDPASLRAALAGARAALGPVGVLHWNAFGGGEIGDILTADPAAVRDVFDIAVIGLLVAVQTALPDLKAAGDGAVLVTNGAFGEINSDIDAYAIGINVGGVALANGAKHKLVGLLSQRLKAEGVHVGEVMVAGAVKGTAYDDGSATIDPAKIADKFWALYQARDAVRDRIG